jgi:tetratricopeptide (TPR) repeat protein
MNGFNETPTPTDLEPDAIAAIAEFEAALRENPKLVDAQAGLAACLGMRMYFHGKMDDEMRSLFARVKELLAEAQSLEPANPRLLWVRGPMEWWTPKGSPQDLVDARQAKAIATYVQALEGLPGSLRSGPEPLRPTWGEPELHMSLAWSYLNRREPDVPQAELHGRKALQLVPSWHYVRDILLPQIESAKRTAAR